MGGDVIAEDSPAPGNRGSLTKICMCIHNGAKLRISMT